MYFDRQIKICRDDTCTKMEFVKVVRYADRTSFEITNMTKETLSYSIIFTGYLNGKAQNKLCIITCVPRSIVCTSWFSGLVSIEEGSLETTTDESGDKIST